MIDDDDIVEPDDLDPLSVSIGFDSMSLDNSDLYTINSYQQIGAPVSMGYVNAQIPDVIDTTSEVDTVAIKGNLTIADIDGNNKIDVGEFMQTISERLCVLQPNLEAHEHYPALKDLYDQYKMLEKLLVDNNAKKD